MTIRTLTSLRSQNKKLIRVISSLVIAIGMMISAIMPFVDYEVKADGEFYREFEGGCVNWIKSVTSQYTSYQTVSTTNGFKAMYVKNPTTGYADLAIIAREDDSIITGDNRTGSGCPAYGTSQITVRTDFGIFKVYNGVHLDYDERSGFPLVDYVENNGINITWLSGPSLGSQYALETLFYYAYGEGSEENQWNYGSLKDLTYSTSIVGSGGGTGEANRDTISWYAFSDSNNKMFGADGVVDLRVVPGDYISGTQEGLFAQQYTDFILDVANAGHLAQVQAYKGSYEVTWGEVMNKLSLAWPSLSLIWDSGYWKKIGWVYQARYHSEYAPDDTWSDWQTVYTITSSTPKGTDGLDPADGTALPGFYENVVDSFNTTSVVNNNVNNIYYVNNIPIITNEDEEPDDPEDYNPILKEMRDILLQIRYMIMNINNAGDNDDPEDTGLRDADDELHRQEELLINDMDDKLGDIDTDVDLLSDNGFLSAANWVRLQYDRITLNSPFELLIVFSLVLGIALIFIGKVR